MKERIKQIRLNLGMNQGEFAHAVNIVQQQLSKYERGENKPSSEFLAVLVEKFNVNINWLLTGKGEIFAGKNSKTAGGNTEKIFFSGSSGEKDGLCFDLHLIKNVWHLDPKNLVLVYMPDDSLNTKENDFFAKKGDILLIDTEYNELGYGIYYYKANGKEFVGSFTPLIDGSFLVGGKNPGITYTPEMIKKSKTVVVGKAVKNLSAVNS